VGTLLKDSIELILAQAVGSVLGYVFYFATARLLGPADFGILGALVSILYIMASLQITLQIVAAKYVSQFKAVSDIDRIKKFNFRALQNVGLWSLALFLVLALASPALSKILRVDIGHLLITFLIFPFMFLVSITRGIFQGLSDFKNLSINIAIEPIVKVSLGLFLVLLGFGLFGALVGIILSFLVPFLLSFVQLNHLIKRTRKKVGKRNVYKYALPVFAVLFIFVVAINLDNLFVKYAFSNEVTGYYSVASLFAKALFYISLAVSMAMFPRVSELHALKLPHKHVFRKAVLYVAVLSVLFLLLVSVFSKELILILFGGSYLEAAIFIPILVGAQMFLSLALVAAFYSISRGIDLRILLFALPLLIEVVLLKTMGLTPVGVAEAVLLVSPVFLIVSLYILGAQEKSFKHVLV